MWQTTVQLKCAIALGCLIGLSSNAADLNQLVDAQDGISWLKKMQAAAQSLNYSGTFIYHQADQLRASRITHLSDGKNELEKLEILDGKPREYIRNNEEIVSYIPETKSIILEKRTVKEVFPSLLSVNPLELLVHYKISIGEAGRVAGFDGQIITLEPRDHLRYGYKFWAEKNKGLLLRAQVLNDKNDIIEQISFANLMIGSIDRKQVKSSFVNLAGWHTENSVLSYVRKNEWLVNWVPPGFRKIREMRRFITVHDRSMSAATSQSQGGVLQKRREVSQIVYSDGLAAISVFIEAYGQGRTEGHVQQGAMNLIEKRQGDFWLIIVGEVPFAAIKKVANSIEYKPY